MLNFISYYPILMSNSLGILDGQIERFRHALVDQKQSGEVPWWTDGWHGRKTWMTYDEIMQL